MAMFWKWFSNKTQKNKVYLLSKSEMSYFSYGLQI
jgi:hypothetical protein